MKSWTNKHQKEFKVLVIKECNGTITAPEKIRLNTLTKIRSNEISKSIPPQIIKQNKEKDELLKEIAMIIKKIAKFNLKYKLNKFIKI